MRALPTEFRMRAAHPQCALFLAQAADCLCGKELTETLGGVRCPAFGFLACALLPKVFMEGGILVIRHPAPALGDRLASKN